MTKKVIYTLRDVTQRYDERTVLQVDFLEIYQGEILAIVGPSGAGKSTLLRQLNFLEKPTAGQLTFQNSPMNGHPPPLELRRQVTTVFQTPILLNRSVADNIAYGLKIRGHNRQATHQAVHSVLKEVGLNHLGQASARTLSGGEAQRVALARTLVLQPQVLLMDEPTANLDPYNIKLIETIISDVNQQRNTTIVLVTHNIFQAKRLADRVAFLLNGQLVEATDTMSFFNAPTDPRTAAFVRGDMVY